MNLAGRTALLTGASTGLGRELALALDARGCRLLLVARSTDRLEELQGQLRTPGSRLHAADLSDAQSRAGLVHTIFQQESRLDLIIHNAGLGSHSRLDQCDAEEVQRLFQLNTVAPLMLTAELQRLLPRGEPAGIVHIGSVAGELITPGMSLYSASKHGLHAFSRAIAIELAADGHFSLLVILGAVAGTSFGQGLSHPIEGQPGWYRRLDLDPRDVAARIVRAIEGERSQLVLPGWYRPLLAASKLLAPVTRRLSARVYRRRGT